MAALWSVRHEQSTLTILVHTKDNASLGSFMASLSSELAYLHPEIYGLKKEGNYAFLLSSAYDEAKLWRRSIETLTLSDFEFDKRRCELNAKKEVRRMNKVAIAHWFLSLTPEPVKQDPFKDLLSVWVN